MVLPRPHTAGWNNKTRPTAKTNLSIILPHDSLGRWSVAEGVLAPLIIIWDVKRLRMGAEDRNMYITQVWLMQTACWRHLSCKVTWLAFLPQRAPLVNFLCKLSALPFLKGIVSWKLNILSLFTHLWSNILFNTTFHVFWSHTLALYEEQTKM